jgi:arylsulfatase A-like enzyme
MSHAQPNLLIIMVDQMQAQLLGANSPVPLPHLTQLAQRSTVLTHAYCPAPICTPTRASFQLGQPVWQHGVLGNDRNMPSETPTLPERLNQQGYATSYVGKWHLDVNNPRGWQHHSLGRSAADAEKGYYVMDGINAPHQGRASYDEDRHVDGSVRTEAMQELARLQTSQQPWALMTSFYGPHAPYYLPPCWYDLLDPAAIDLPDDFDTPFENKPEIQTIFRCRAWGQTWSRGKWQAIRAAYFGYTAMLDHFIGQILAQMDTSNTAVLFLSDHGEMNGHQRMIYKGPMMYEQLVHVPMLLALPGQAKQVHDDRLCLTHDLTAALLRLAGDNAYAACLPTINLLDASEPGREHVTSEFHEANWVKPVVSQRVAMLRDEHYKYVFTEGQQCELYDMKATLPEVKNLAVKAEFTEKIQQMHAKLCDAIPWVGDVSCP